MLEGLDLLLQWIGGVVLLYPWISKTNHQGTSWTYEVQTFNFGHILKPIFKFFIYPSSQVYVGKWRCRVCTNSNSNKLFPQLAFMEYFFSYFWMRFIKFTRKYDGIVRSLISSNASLRQSLPSSCGIFNRPGVAGAVL